MASATCGKEDCTIPTENGSPFCPGHTEKRAKIIKRSKPKPKPGGR